MDEYLVIRSRKVLPLPSNWNGISQTRASNTKFHGTVLKREWVQYTRGNYTAIFEREDWQRAGEALAKRMLSDNKYVAKVCRNQLKAGQKLVKLSEKVRRLKLDKKPTDELLGLCFKIREAWVSHDDCSVYPWFVAGDIFAEKVREKSKMANEEFMVLSTPAELTFSTHEELRILRLVLKITGKKLKIEKLPSGILAEVDKLVEDYYWIPFGYDGPTLYDRTHYLSAISELARTSDKVRERLVELEGYEKNMHKTQERIMREHEFNAELKQQVHALQDLAIITDRRKEFTFQAHVALDLLVTEICRRLLVPKNYLKQLTLEEIKEHAGRPNELIKMGKRRDEGTTVFLFEKGRPKIFEGKEAEEISEKIMPIHLDCTELKGTVGSKSGCIIGKARVILSAQDIDTMQDGEILITTMTTPEFVPAMRKACAVVTDEGGVTCHAAIVSRELGIPAIIATKKATKIFKDGDLVEVDTENGIVRKVISY